MLQITLVSCLYSQVAITGQVTFEGNGQSDVMLQVFEHGKISRTVAANKRGKYQVDLPFNHKYVIVYRCPYMIPVSIEINTTFPIQSNENLTIEVPVNMELFNRFEELDITPYKEPIGTVRKSNNDSEKFEFYPDTRVLNKVKAVNAKSGKLKVAGKLPIDTDDAEIRRMVRGEDRPIAEVESGDEKVVPEETNPEKLEPTIDEFEAKADATVDHYSTREEATETAVEKLKTRQKVALESESKKTDDQVEHIHDSKFVKSEQLTQAKEREEALLRARVMKQEALAEGLENSPTIRQRTPLRRLPKSKAAELGFFHSEEVLEVSYGQTLETYRHDNYDWFFFEVNYYYLGDTEISKNQYDQIRALFE